MGRHSSYTPEIGDRIASLIIEDKTYQEIADSMGINKATIFNWLQNNEDFSTKCNRAKCVQAEAIEQKLMNIQQDVMAGLIAPDAARVAVSLLQWRAAKKNPKVYGDKTILSNDPDNPVTSLALRLDTAINQQNRMIDVTPEKTAIPAPEDGSDLV